MIGNDIIDFQVSSFPGPGERRNRYLEKLFTENEREYLNELGITDTNVCIFWSMKEAAWKAHQRELSLPRKFAPKELVCEILETHSTRVKGRVEVKGHEYNTQISLTSAHLHCIAFSSVYSKISSQILPISTDLKKKFLDHISAVYKLPQENLHLKKDKNHIPYLFYCGEEMEVGFSFSGHGKFLAYSTTLINS